MRFLLLPIEGLIGLNLYLFSILVVIPFQLNLVISKFTNFSVWTDATRGISEITRGFFVIAGATCILIQLARQRNVVEKKYVVVTSLVIGVGITACAIQIANLTVGTHEPLDTKAMVYAVMRDAAVYLCLVGLYLTAIWWIINLGERSTSERRIAIVAAGCFCIEVLLWLTHSTMVLANIHGSQLWGQYSILIFWVEEVEHFGAIAASLAFSTFLILVLVFEIRIRRKLKQIWIPFLKAGNETGT